MTLTIQSHWGLEPQTTLRLEMICSSCEKGSLARVPFLFFDKENESEITLLGHSNYEITTTIHLCFYNTNMQKKDISDVLEI